eukprot:1019306-Heterocapsa_arctica.AAC.1
MGRQSQLPGCVLSATGAHSATPPMLASSLPRDTWRELWRRGLALGWAAGSLEHYHGTSLQTLKEDSTSALSVSGPSWSSPTLSFT